MKKISIFSNNTINGQNQYSEADITLIENCLSVTGRMITWQSYFLDLNQAFSDVLEFFLRFKKRGEEEKRVLRYDASEVYLRFGFKKKKNAEVFFA